MGRDEIEINELVRSEFSRQISGDTENSRLWQTLLTLGKTTNDTDRREF